MTLNIGPHIVGQDRRRSSGTRAASTRNVSAPLTEEEHTLFRMACLSLGMTNRQFIQEALMFYAMWAVDHARTFNSPSLVAREGIGLRADIETDIARWRAFTGDCGPIQQFTRTAAE